MPGHSRHHRSAESGIYHLHPGSTVLGLPPLGWFALISAGTILIVAATLWTVFFGFDPELFLATGNPAVVANDGQGPMPMALDEGFSRSLFEWGYATAAYDDAIRRGRSVAVAEGTEVRIIDFRMNLVRVRIVAGPLRGETGWIRGDWVQAKQ